MTEERDIRKEAYKLYFMYNKIDVPRMSLNYWMTIPDFVERMLKMVSNSEAIDNKSVYRVMQEIYSDMEQYRKTDVGKAINYRLARSAINKLKSAIGEV